MKRLTLAAVVVSSLSVFAQGAPPPPPAKGAPPPPPAKNAPAPAPAAAPAPAPAAAAAPAPAPAPAAAMDMSKMGPGSRKPTNEAKTKKDIEAFFKDEDAVMAKKDWDAMLNRIDFPVTMITDNSAGMPSSKVASREEYLAEMKPFWENMPAGYSMKHKFNISVLSDSLAEVVDDFDMTMGKTKTKGKNSMTLVKVGGMWKVKTMVEAGWGDMSGGGGGGNAAPPPPANTNSAPPPPPAKGAPPPPPAPKK